MCSIHTMLVAYLSLFLFPALYSKCHRYQPSEALKVNEKAASVKATPFNPEGLVKCIVDTAKFQSKLTREKIIRHFVEVSSPSLSARWRRVSWWTLLYSMYMFCLVTNWNIMQTLLCWLKFATLHVCLQFYQAMSRLDPAEDDSPDEDPPAQLRGEEDGRVADGVMEENGAEVRLIIS